MPLDYVQMDYVIGARSTLNVSKTTEVSAAMSAQGACLGIQVCQHQGHSLLLAMLQYSCSCQETVVACNEAAKWRRS